MSRNQLEGAWVGAGAVPGTRAPLVPNGGPEGAVRPAPRLRRRPLAPRVGPAGRHGPAATAKAGRRGQAGRGGAEPGRSGALGAGQPGWEFWGEDGERGVAVPGERRGRGPPEPAPAVAGPAATPAPRALEPRPREAAAPGHRGGERAAAAMRPPSPGPATRAPPRPRVPPGPGCRPATGQAVCPDGSGLCEVLPVSPACPGRATCIRAAGPGLPENLVAAFRVASGLETRFHGNWPRPRSRASKCLKQRVPRQALPARGAVPRGWKGARETHSCLVAAWWLTGCCRQAGVACRASPDTTHILKPGLSHVSFLI